MEFAGIITEYDPFHSGHAAQIAAAKAAAGGGKDGDSDGRNSGDEGDNAAGQA